MRNFFWQRCALIFMLVSRLVIGELGHAMPVAHSMDTGRHAHHQLSQMAAAAADPAACPERDGSKEQTPPAHPAGDSAADTSSSQKDCCKSGECECPCLHVPCVALDALVLSPVATTLLRAPHGAEGLILQRPSRLFRPPA